MQTDDNDRDLFHVFADALSPEAFTMPSSAFRATQQPEPADLEAWRTSALADALAFRYPESNEFVHGVIIVQDAATRWEWHYEPDHPLKWLVPSVRKEIVAFAAPWVLAAVVPGPRHGYVQRENPLGWIDETYELIEEAWDLPWYVEVRRPGLAEIRSGCDSYRMNTLAAAQETDPERDWFARDMVDLLRGHSSRRRHRRRPGT